MAYFILLLRREGYSLSLKVSIVVRFLVYDEKLKMLFINYYKCHLCIASYDDMVAQWRSGRALDLRSLGRGLDCVATLGKLFTPRPMCLCQQAV